MVKSSRQIELEFINQLAHKTEKSLDEWIETIRSSGHSNRNSILDWLKSEYRFVHVNASLLAGIYMNGGQAVYGSSSGLLADQFVKKEHLKPLYQTLMECILKKIPETRVEIKKTYTSLNAKREYAAIGIKSNEIRLAVDLKGEPDGIGFQKMTGIGCRPRISHMIKIAGDSQIDDKLIKNLKTAFEKLNK